MSTFDRRRFLALGAGAVSGLWLAACSGSSGSADGSSTTATGGDGSSTTAGSGGPASSAASSSAPAATKPKGRAGRRLVIVELDGGNDGMSTLVPYGMSGYRDLRQRTALDDDQLVHLNDQVGLPKELQGLKDKGLAVLQGVGTEQPDGSHFEMMDRWWRGDVTGKAGLATGFLGRLADQMADPAAKVVGLSFGSGNHPAIQAAKASTLALPSASSGGYLAGASSDDPRALAFQNAIAAMAAGVSPDAFGLARKGIRDAVGIAQMLNGLGEDKDPVEYPGSNLGQSLRLSARLLAADPLVRVVHVPMGADFDTHQNHPDRHRGLMQELNDALVAFLDDLEGRGLGDEVLVATTSEFGRTARDNGSDGLDHGTASVALLAGKMVKAGVHGEHPSLTKLSDEGQLVATVGFDRYYATLAESWLGVPASEVLATKPQPIAGLFS